MGCVHMACAQVVCVQKVRRVHVPLYRLPGFGSGRGGLGSLVRSRFVTLTARGGYEWCWYLVLALCNL